MDRFGTEKSLEKLEGETEFTYHLEFSREEQCFYINEESIEFTVKVKEGEPQLFIDKNDEDFIASMENITPEYDKTNNIQIKVNIPFAPFLYYCFINELQEEQEGEKDDGTERIIYDEILTPGEYITYPPLNSSFLFPFEKFKNKDCIFVINLLIFSQVNHIS